MPKITSIISWLILMLLFFAIYSTGALSLQEFRIGNICPSILKMPACYIVMICFIGGVIGQLTDYTKSSRLFFLAVGTVFIIALIGTVGEFVGFAKCPRISSGMPMCFISLALCTTLLVLKFLEIRYKRR